MSYSARGHPLCMKALLNAGADQKIPHNDGMYPIHFAASQYRDCVRELLKNDNAAHAYKDKEGITPLMVAAIEGETNIILQLITAGADVNAEVPGHFFKREDPETGKYPETAITMAHMEGKAKVQTLFTTLEHKQKIDLTPKHKALLEKVINYKQKHNIDDTKPIAQ